MSLSRFEYTPELVGPGQWHEVRGALKALVVCPTCGKFYALGKYRVMSGGVIAPTLTCPHGCGYYEHAILVDWERCH